MIIAHKILLNRKHSITSLENCDFKWYKINKRFNTGDQALPFQDILFENV